MELRIGLRALLGVVAGATTCLGLSGVALGENSCQPAGAKASLTFTGGQPLGCFHDVVVPGETSSTRVEFDASCPLNGSPPKQHVWYVQIDLKHEDGSGQSSGPLQAPIGTESFGGHEDFALGILPPSAKTDRVSWNVVNHCNGGQQVIGSGTCVLCRGATSTDDSGENYIKTKEGVCRTTGKGKKRRRVCGEPVLHEYDNDGSEKGNCTIGWGHLIHTGKCVCPDLKAACANQQEKPFHKGITRKKAQALLDADLAKAEKHIRKTSPVPVSQCQMNGLVDWFFNHGNRSPSARINRDLARGDFLEVSIDIGVRYGTPDPSRQDRDQQLLMSANCQDC